jgi:hypothetical protein
VFREWKEDTPSMLKDMLDDDYKYWKINRFIKDDSDVRQSFSFNIF